MVITGYFYGDSWWLIVINSGSVRDGWSIVAKHVIDDGFLFGDFYGILHKPYMGLFQWLIINWYNSGHNWKLSTKNTAALGTAPELGGTSCSYLNLLW